MRIIECKMGFIAVPRVSPSRHLIRALLLFCLRTTHCHIITLGVFFQILWEHRVLVAHNVITVVIFIFIQPFHLKKKLQETVCPSRR